MSQPHPRIRLEACLIDLERRVAIWPERERKLTENEAGLMAYLATHPNQTLTKETLLEEVWGYAAGVESRTTAVTIHRLRSKVEVDPKNPRHIVTVYGVGFRLEDAEILASASATSIGASRWWTNNAAP